MKTFLSVILVLAIASVSNYPGATGIQNDSREKVTINFERGPCPSECSVFTITIRPDRSVEYEGKKFTRVLGKRSFTISTSAYKSIMDAVERARVEQLKDEYAPVPGRDAGSIILRFSWGEKTKQILHFLPSPDAPEQLENLEDVIVKNAYPRE